MVDYSVNLNSSVYYVGRYWNELPQVIALINERISGSPECSWESHFARRADRTFKCALMLNCGNGWVERSLWKQGLIAEAVGIDCSESLLTEARQAAAGEQVPVEYMMMDVNSVLFPDRDFDLVVNVGSAHHIAYVDRVFRALCKLLPEDGWFVSFDYVGPHRNQYSTDAWEAAWALNGSLPEEFRQDMHYPHLPTMLSDDPTEAIHSELVAEAFHRYFVVDQFVPLGGALAYPLLTHNAQLFAAPEGPARDACIDRIVTADRDFLASHPGSALFAYFAGRPDKTVLHDEVQLESWSHEEGLRETRARDAGGEYYPHSAFQTEYLRRVELEHELAAVRAHLDQLQEEITAFRNGSAYLLARRVARSHLGRLVRSSPRLRRAAAKLAGR